MKSHMKAPIAALLILASAAAAVSCGENTAVPETTKPVQSGETAAAETEAAETTQYYEPDSLPADLNFGGKTVNVFGWDGAANNEFFVEEQDGDIVHDAIFNRNKAVEERLDITLNYTLAPGAYNDRDQWVKMIAGSIMAGDGAYDIAAGYSMCGATLAYRRLLLDLTQQEYIDFSKPWWPQSLIKEATCGGKLYFCSGDISANMIDYLYGIFFNKQMITDYDLENPYQAVKDGTWTLDKLKTMSSGVYKDLNGDGKKDLSDQIGYVVQSVWSDTFFFASGLRTSQIGSDGLPMLSEEFGGEKTQALLENLLDFFSKDYAYFGEETNDIRNTFIEGRSLFLTHEIYFSGKFMRDSQVEYGLLPIPKYDEAQSDYYTVSSFPYTLYGIPVDVKDPSMSAAVLEALASESYRTVSPALFETALKVKYASDNEVSEMYDIIRASNVFDIGRIFNDSMNGKTYSMFRSSLQNKNANWISTYNKELKSLSKNYQKVIDALIAEE